MTVTLSSSCAGACCAVFPMPLGSPKTDEPTEEQAFIEDMRIELTRTEAEERYARLGYGELPVWREGWDHRLYTCRHWDEQTRLCTVYEQRPTMCRDYPYEGHQCERACGFELSQEQLDAIAERKDSQWAWDAVGEGWRPRSNSEFEWDPEAGVIRRRREAVA